MTGGTIARPPLPRRLHVEVTNRCNSECETCIRTFDPDPDRDLSLDEVTRIVDGLPDLESVALQVNGEPLLYPHLRDVLRLLAQRGVRAELNTNAIGLSGERARALLEEGLAQVNVSLDGATAETYRRIRGVDAFARVVDNVRAFAAARLPSSSSPRVSLWMTMSRHNLDELPALVDLAAALGVEEVYMQRLVFLGRGLARSADSLHGRLEPRHRDAIAEASRRAGRAGVALTAAGRRDPADMLVPPVGAEPWRQCARPFSSAVVMADGDVVPCCIATFVAPRRELRMGNVLTQGWDRVWGSDRYVRMRADLREGPSPPFCTSCGVRWSL